MAKASSVDGVQANGEVSRAMDELKSFTRNRQRSTAEIEREKVEHPGWVAARSLDGSHTLAYARTVDEMRTILLDRGLRFCDVVLDAIEDDVIDVDGCRL